MGGARNRTGPALSSVSINAGSKSLVIGGWLSVGAALLHVGCIIGGPDWYRFFGAGEDFARWAESGSWMPHILTAGIAIILTVWALFAFSGAGRFAKLPLLRTGLIVISGIYLLRGLVLIPAVLFSPQPLLPFDYWSSAIVLVYGLLYAFGTWRAWPALS